ncbi:MAG: DNA polymerase domain-containing protein [Verrucomicrobiota bacterium]|nr:DNA polymerase domain-containing protein [Verrucomicrobiota bacterium]
MKNDSPFSQNKLLFGRDPEEAIVAVEQASDYEMEIFTRHGKTLSSRKVEFTPFLWTVDGALGKFPGKADTESFSGEYAYTTLATFPDWKTYSDARKSLTSQKAPCLALNDPIHQFLLATGKTFFKGMLYEGLHRMQLDIETNSTGEEFSNAQKEDDRILAIAVSDNHGWEEVLTDGDESKLLQRLNKIIKDKDPDIIEGHNIFRFDLPYIQARAKRHKVKLEWGRDGSALSSRASRLQIAERTLNYPKFEIYGRHIIDTYILVLFYDVGTRELESFSLKEVAKHFGFASKDRTYIDGAKIAQTFKDDPEKAKAYALDDVRETRAISGLLSQSYFIQAQIFPYHFQNVIIRGNATKIDSLFLREYFEAKKAIPFEPEARGFPGGYTDIFFEGVARNVWHCDVASLYPSVMLAFDYVPKKDTLGIFKKMLIDLREFRLNSKKLAQNAETKAEKDHYQALQQTFKILINSFYGYLGFEQAHFADFTAASEVTAKGREIITEMMNWLKDRGAKLIELDTDGIYFVPPADGAEKLEDDIQKILPPGITVEFDERYEAMFSYKAKNYALLKQDDSIVIKGASMKSRGLEKFQRTFMEETVSALLHSQPAKVSKLLEEYRNNLTSGKWPVEIFMKTDTLQDSLVKYQEKISGSARNRAAAYELALKSGRNLQPGDQVSYYITGKTKKVKVFEAAKLAAEWNPEARDENIDYYLSKLDELYKKFEPFLNPVTEKEPELF